MIGSIILFGAGLVLVFIGILVGLIYSWESKIKINNNPNYKSDSYLQEAHQDMNIASWICIISSVILILIIAGVVFFSEVLMFFIKWILIGTCVIYFIILVVVEYYMFSGLINMKKSPNFSPEDNPDDGTALRDGRIGAWSIFIAIVLILVVGGLVLFGKFKKKLPKKEKEETEDDEDDEE